MVIVREATKEDAPAILTLAEEHRHELGAISSHRQWLKVQIDEGEVFVAKTVEGKVVGFVSFHHHRHANDEHTTVNYLCTNSALRRLGIGKLLMEAVAADARLRAKTRIMVRCPGHLPANHFYESIGYTLKRSETDHEGVRLNVWTLSL